ncbi:hypothetical protein RHGRI_025914 [Rhododendron griersonianum]|uniref:Uncharacterized protein n=1 Tax=Rhododendron griersonianum TaxID=479676 RepID=A0AAV6IUC3_9ERIC|nr:hypothetical protein RHGRI_025914 [Rhododendron griersonianum]
MDAVFGILWENGSSSVFMCYYRLSNGRGLKNMRKRSYGIGPSSLSLVLDTAEGIIVRLHVLLQVEQWERIEKHEKEKLWHWTEASVIRF